MSDNVVVASCVKVKDVQWKDKMVNIYKIGFSDNTFAESFGKEIAAGTPITDLVIEESERGRKVKPKQQQGGGGRGGGRPPEHKNGSFAMSYAKDIQVAHIMMGKEFKTQDMLTVAEVLYKWLEAHK